MTEIVPLSDDDMVILAIQEPATLAEWWCKLNRYEIVDGLVDRTTSKNYWWSIMCWIQKRIGVRACLRQWNLHMSDDEFDDFWRGFHEGDDEAMARWEQRVKEGARWKST